MLSTMLGSRESIPKDLATFLKELTQFLLKDKILKCHFIFS